MTIGKMIKVRLIENGASIGGFAKTIGISSTMLSLIITGRQNLTVNVAAKIGQELGVGFGEELLKMQSRERLASDLEQYNKLIKEAAIDE